MIVDKIKRKKSAPLKILLQLRLHVLKFYLLVPRVAEAFLEISFVMVTTTVRTMRMKQTACFCAVKMSGKLKGLGYAMVTATAENNANEDYCFKASLFVKGLKNASQKDWFATGKIIVGAERMKQVVRDIWLTF